MHGSSSRPYTIISMHLPSGHGVSPRKVGPFNDAKQLQALASNPGLTHPDYISLNLGVGLRLCRPRAGSSLGLSVHGSELVAVFIRCMPGMEHTFWIAYYG